jgi:hypothetical protein
MAKEIIPSRVADNVLGLDHDEFKLGMLRPCP